jgi:predicted transposase YbfD/YdcC
MKMKILDELREEMELLELGSEHNGYWYSVSDVMIILVCGMLCKLEKIVDIATWARSTPTKKFLKDYFDIEGVPSVAQFYNILGYVNAETFNESFQKWMNYVLNHTTKGKTVAIDGKTIRSTDTLTPDGSVLHIASALVSELNLVLGSIECQTKTGEINVFRELVGSLELEGAMVVADALHCKPKSAQAVVDAKADYLLVVKDNQGTLKEDIKLYIQNEEVESFQTIEKNGGRIETRTAYVSTNVDWLEQKDKWAKLSSVGAIHREFEKNGHKSSEWHYYISSAELTAEEMLRHARMEWAVESMHWLLDVHFREDQTGVFDMNVQKVLNTARKVTLNMLRLFKDANCRKSTPLSGIMRNNLFDFEHLGVFLDFFTQQSSMVSLS